MKHLFFNIILLLSITSNGQTMANSKEILVPFCNAENKWGFMSSTTKQVVIATKYDNAWPEKNGLLKVAYNNPKGSSIADQYLFGLLDNQGNEILPCAYQDVYDKYGTPTTQIYKNLYAATNDNGTGIYDIQLKKWVIPQGYIQDGKYSFYGDTGIVCNEKEFFFDGKKYTAPKGYVIESVDMDKQWFFIQKNEMTKGIVKWTGETILPSNYSDINFAGKSVKRIIACKPDFNLTNPKNYLKLLDALKNGADEKKDMAISEIYDTNGKLLKSIKAKRNLFATNNSDKTTFIQNGITKEIDLVTMQITEGEFEGAVTVFSDKDQYGIKDHEGNILIKPEYLKIKYFNKNVIIAQNGDYKYGLINENNAIVVPFEYQNIQEMYSTGELFYVSKNGKYGATDAKGNIIVPCIYEYNFSFQGDFAQVYNGKWGIIDKAGKEVIPFIYDNIYDTEKVDGFENINYIVTKDGKSGLLNKSGRILIPLKYSFITDLRKTKDDEWFKVEDITRKYKGLYNIKTAVFVEPKYYWLTPYQNILIAHISENDKDSYSFLDLKGNIIAGLTFDKVNDVEAQNGYFIVTRDKKVGLLDKNGKEIFPLLYDSLQFKTPEFLLATKDGKQFYVDVMGNEYIDSIK